MSQPTNVYRSSRGSEPTETKTANRNIPSLHYATLENCPGHGIRPQGIQAKNNPQRGRVGDEGGLERYSLDWQAISRPYATMAVAPGYGLLMAKRETSPYSVSRPKSYPQVINLYYPIENSRVAIS
jgi:hypothetical protein